MKRSLRISAWALRLGAFAALAVSATASAGTLDDIRARGRLIVGVKTDYAPLGFIDAGGRNAGVEVELARYIAGKLLGDPDKIEFVLVVFRTRVDYLLAKKIDMILATMVTTPERLKIVDASIPYLRPGGGTLMAPKDGPVTSWETTRGHDVCANESAYFNPTILGRFGARIIEFPETELAYQALAARRCAAYAFDEILVRLKVKDPQWTGYAVVGEPLQTNGHHIGVRKNDEEFLAQLDRLVLQAQAEGRIVGWEEQYGMDPDAWSLEQVDLAKRKLGQ